MVKWDAKVQMIAEQGLEMGRPSRIVADAEIVNGQAQKIHVGGQCVLVGSGSLNIS
ncbi:MAG: putative PhzF superfamily epimerase YddE/YHI9 [Candidatus Krumholzibacteriia bacterium]